MTNSLVKWLDRAPIDDPVDLRNARVIQSLLLFLAVSVPLMMLFGVAMTWSALVSGPVHWALLVSFSLSLLIATLAAVGVRMIRRGRFRPAVRMLIAVLLGGLAINAVANGFDRQLPDQLSQMLVLILSGLVLGKRALWMVFFALLAIIGLGCVRDALTVFAQTPGRALYNLPSTVFSYLLVAVLIDRTTDALRESLRESNLRGQALSTEIREREKIHAQLIHAQKKEIAERLAIGMAHDFNNIFSVISGFSNERHQDDAGRLSERVEQLEQSLAAVEDAARRGLAISRKLLRFSRLDAPLIETFDASEAIAELQPMLRQLLESRIVLRFQPCATPLPIAFDRSQFELILLNLASNARDATRGHGSFSLTTAQMDDHAVIEVQDEGDGIPDAIARKVFDPFFSTKPADSGTGLGLAVVKQLIASGGGGIGFASAVGRGTTFRIELPLIRQV
ncbi:histidine kinase [Xanthomonas arboricola]|uniref:sensor histidine kinase n=1 Tax=Xanthomonas arboricola TaxID=56448 RepID=UPI00061A1F63|nr:HAMP domain-containing sensor histidine kinase [Xanthomonas arboricola]AKC81507.1 histidine kinase [Xanthomonas arboricola]